MFNRLIAVLTILCVALCPAWASAHGAVHAAGGGHGTIRAALVSVPSQAAASVNKKVLSPHKHGHGEHASSISEVELADGSLILVAEISSTLYSTSDAFFDSDAGKDCKFAPTQCCSVNVVTGVISGDAPVSLSIPILDIPRSIGNDARKPVWRSDGQPRPPRI